MVVDRLWDSINNSIILLPGLSRVLIDVSGRTNPAKPALSLPSHTRITAPHNLVTYLFDHQRCVTKPASITLCRIYLNHSDVSYYLTRQLWGTPSENDRQNRITRMIIILDALS